MTLTSCGGYNAKMLTKRSKDSQPRWHSHLWVFWVSLIAIWSALLASVGIADAGDVRLLNWLATLTTIGMIFGAIGWGVTRRRAHNRYAAELVKWSTDRAAIAERLAVARDLHDLVSNGLGAITMRAAAARLTASNACDDAAVIAFTEIEQASRQATLELRRMLFMLRASDSTSDSTSDDSTSTGSDPGSAGHNLATDLMQIISANRSAGLDISFNETALSALYDIPSTTQMTICAIIREGLTNVMRHCEPSRADLDISRQSKGIVIVIRDDGAAPGYQRAAGTGLGLTGLRERVQAVGGTLSACANPGASGWVLKACLPDTGVLDYA